MDFQQQKRFQAQFPLFLDDNNMSMSPSQLKMNDKNVSFTEMNTYYGRDNINDLFF
jgi:hypothetical protein